MDEDEPTVAELISAVTEFNDIHEFLNDSDVDEAMALVIRLITKPNVPPHAAAPLIVNTQALSSKFYLMGKNYMILPNDNISKEDRSKRKNLLLSLSDTLEKLSNSLKYLVK